MVRFKLKSFFFCLLSSFAFLAVANPAQSGEAVKKKRKSASTLAAQMVDFKYDQEDLKTILHDFAQERGINLIHNETDTIASKVTFDAGKKITMAEAWEFVLMFLNQAGFSLVYRDDYTYYVMANKNALKESVPLYINVDYQSLPDTLEKIRYVYFCNSIQIAKQQAELTNILKNIFSEVDFAEKVIFDPNFNTIIFTASSEMIKAAMQLIYVFDEVGFKETVEIMELQWARSSEVAQILTNMIGATDKKPAGISLASSAPKSKYFSEYASIVDVDSKGIRKINSLLIMGKTEDVARIKEFIKKHLDIPQQAGKTFYHVVELEWIKAADFATLLTSLLQGPQGGSGQSTGTILSELAFDPQVKVIAEQVTQVAPPTTTNTAGGSPPGNTVQRGGNRVVIAAPERDWHRLESLIKQVDIPRKQVVIEMLVVDLDLQFIRRLATQLRTRGLCPAIFPKDMQAQAGLIFGNVVRTDSNNNVEQNWVADLSQILSGSTNVGGGFNDSGYQNNGQIAWQENFASPIFNSSTLFMVKQENTASAVWAFFQLLTTHKSAKILTRPVIVASNNRPANITSAALKNLAGGVSSGNSPTINYGISSAPVVVDFTPIISANNTVNLQLSIGLNQWLDALNDSSGNQTNRSIVTNVSMRSGDIMIIGGLIREVVNRSKTSVPFFDAIPVLGSFLANRFKNTTRDQLFILIRPTVIAPRKQGGMGSITRSASNFVISEFEDYEDSFTALRDPITRWFFNEDLESGSVKVDSKMSSLSTMKDLPSVESRQADLIKEFVKPVVNNNPLGVNWFSDSTHSKDRVPPAGGTLDEKVKKIVNPFEKRLEI